MSIDKVVRRLVTVTTAGVGLVLVSTLVTALTPSLRWPFGAEQEYQRIYRQGDRTELPSMLGLDFDNAVLIFARSSCGGCQRAKGFLRSLVAAVQARSTSNILILSQGKDREREAEYAHAIGLPAESLLGMPAGFRVRVVPTLLVVDRTGTVLLVREGMPEGPHEQAALLETVTELVTHD